MSVSIRQLFVPLAEEEKLPSFDTAFDSDRRPTVPTKPLYSSRRLKRERFDESGVPTCDKDSPKRQLQTRTNVAAERKKNDWIYCGPLLGLKEFADESRT